MKLSSIHVKSLAINSANISTETIDGDEHIVIRGVVPVVDDVVMNGGLYPAEEINKSFKTLEGNQMPLGHPKIGGEYVSANNPRAVNKFHVGAWAENVRKDGDRVVMDMFINKRFASATDKGKRVLERLDDLAANSDAKPIHVSTGLLLQREKNSGKSKGKKYTWVARNMLFDHVAILLDEQGAATPDDGVGIFVNASNEKQDVDIEQVNLSEAADYRGSSLVDNIKFHLFANSDLSFDDISSRLYELINQSSTPEARRWIQSIWTDKFVFHEGNKSYQQKYLISDEQVTLVGDPVEVVRKPTEYEEVKTTNKELNPMKEKMIAALNAAGVKTDGLTDDQVWDAYNEQMKPATTAINEDAITAAVTKAVGPLNEKLANLETQLSANADKEKSDKRAAVKAKFSLDDVAVNALDGAALDGLYAQCQTSSPINPAFNFNSADTSISDMPE